MAGIPADYGGLNDMHFDIDTNGQNSELHESQNSKRVLTPTKIFRKHYLDSKLASEVDIRSSTKSNLLHRSNSF